MLAAYMVLSFYNFHERSEFTSIFTSTLTSETSVMLYFGVDLNIYCAKFVVSNYIKEKEMIF